MAGHNVIVGMNNTGAKLPPSGSTKQNKFSASIKRQKPVAFDNKQI